MDFLRSLTCILTFVTQISYYGEKFIVKFELSCGREGFILELEWLWRQKKYCIKSATPQLSAT